MRVLITGCMVVFASVWAFSTPPGGAMQGADDAAANATLFRQTCAGCHGDDGAGDTDIGRQMGIPDLRADEIQAMTEAQLTEAVVAVPIHGTFQAQLGSEGLGRAVRHVLALDPGD